MNQGERQVAPTLGGIRRDHRARYEYAARTLPQGSSVIDFACGVGYGAAILAQAGHRVRGYDCDHEAIAYANRHYAAPGVTYLYGDGNAPPKLFAADAALCFETVEHIEDPRALLKALREAAPRLFASVPNEAVMPWQIAPGVTTAFHFRHYTREQFEALLAECGWQVTTWVGQAGPESEVALDTNGRTLIALCERAQAESAEQLEPVRLVPAATPVALAAAPESDALHAELAGKHIAIVGLGPSADTYAQVVKGKGGRSAFCDETWGINAQGNVLACDRVFHMDDVRIQQIRADADPDGNIAAMLVWMKTDPGPIITSRAHPDYPGLVEFPLEAVINAFPLGYFNSTAAYAVAYAIHHGVAKISLFGCDFTWPDAHQAEKGRACVEYWLGMAAERGIKLLVPKTSSLLDACNTQSDRFYGYDTVELAITRQGERICVAMTERVALPSAAEIEARYDHSQHPSPLMAANEG